MGDCVFCRIVSKDEPAKILYENERVLAFAARKPVSKGHTLLIPKKHCEGLFDVGEEDAAALGLVAAQWSRRLRDENHATGMNLLHASGKDAQQSVFHLHYHLVPRYPGDGLDLWLREGL